MPLNLRQAGLSLCMVVAMSLPMKGASASIGHASLGCVLKEYTVRSEETLKDVVKRWYQRTLILDTHGHPRGSYPTRLEDMERYQAAVSFLNNMDLSTEVQPGQKLVLLYGGSLVCTEFH